MRHHVYQDSRGLTGKQHSVNGVESCVTNSDVPLGDFGDVAVHILDADS
jgi:hypothetical protein